MEKNEPKLELGGTKEEIREYWDREGKHGFFESKEEEKAWKSALYKELGKGDKKILDVGTGNGSLALALAELGHDLVGIDISEEMLSVAKEKAEERKLDIDFRIGDAESLSFDEESFDAVVSRVVLWTLLNPKKALKEWNRVLRPNGTVYVFVTNPDKRRGEIERKIKENLGYLLISLLEGENGWKRDYSSGIREELPLAYPNSSILEKIELLRKEGFKDVSVFKMDKVSGIAREEQRKRMQKLTYKLIWGSYDHSKWYYIKGRKAEEQK